jgi:hypothetical protein
MIAADMENAATSTLSGPSADLALGQLDQIFASPSFSASPRCRDFLGFVVRETLVGRGDSIKERTIAMEVFGKDSSFEPGEDSLVRVKAREVRKRLSEFYELHPESVVRIALPLGGYVPTFHQLEPEGPPEPMVDRVPVAEPRRMSRRAWLWGGVGCAAAAAAWPVWRYAQGPSTPLDRLWAPIFATRTPLLISIPQLRAQDGSLMPRVGLGAATAANEAAEFLSSRRYPYRLRFGADLTFSQLREQPSLLLGGFSSTWTTQETDGLRFSMLPVEGGGVIHDAKTQTNYGPVLVKRGYAPEDYALICRLFDASLGQIILIAAGITTFGTESAARFLFRSELFEQIVAGHGTNWYTDNFQAVIKVSVVDATPSTPTLVATHFWK